MGLLERLGKRSAAFYFVEREGIAFEGSHELFAIAARWLRPSDPFCDLPDVRPVWTGSFLPFEDAFDRWAFRDVYVVAIGCVSAKERQSLVAHVRKNPPLGMFDLDADGDEVVRDRPLPLYGFVLPNALIRRNLEGRRIDRRTLLDEIGFADDEEATAFDVAVDGIVGPPAEDALGAALLRLLARGAGRRAPGARSSDGYEALLDHAYELFGLGAISASGSVAGVAFEQLMRAAVEPSWLCQQEAQGHVSLNNVVVRAAGLRSENAARLHRYRSLRNDLAHRLGDEPQAPRTDEELYEEVGEFLRWLDRQAIDDAGTADLVDVAPDPDLTYEELLAEAKQAGDEAAAGARVTPMRIGGDVMEPMGFAWVVVRDPRRSFTRWLVGAGHAEGQGREVTLHAPGMSFERNLAWAQACASRLRRAGQDASYAGRPD